MNKEKLIVKFKKLHEKATLPKRGSEHAGGWDTTCTEIEYRSDNLVICKLGWAAEPPEGYKITLVPRSSLTNYNWVMQNSPGLGDLDFRGEYTFRFRPIPVDVSEGYLIYEKFPYEVGERIGQMYLEEVIEIETEWTDELSDTKRGTGGFGSTGKN